MKDEAEQPLTYKQTLMELSLLARRAAQLAQLEKLDADVRALFITISSVDSLLQGTAK